MADTAPSDTGMYLFVPLRPLAAVALVVGMAVAGGTLGLVVSAGGRLGLAMWLVPVLGVGIAVAIVAAVSRRLPVSGGAWTADAEQVRPRFILQGLFVTGGILRRPVVWAVSPSYVDGYGGFSVALVLTDGSVVEEAARQPVRVARPWNAAARRLVAAPVPARESWYRRAVLEDEMPALCGSLLAMLSDDVDGEWGEWRTLPPGIGRRMELSEETADALLRRLAATDLVVLALDPDDRPAAYRLTTEAADWLNPEDVADDETGEVPPDDDAG